MGQTLRLDWIRACSIPALALLALGTEVRANSIQWDVIGSEAPRNTNLQIQWIDLPPPPPLPPLDQNTIAWTEVDETNESERRTNQIAWEVLSEQESSIPDEQIAEQSSPNAIPPLVIPPSPLQALDRSIAFEDGFVGPDISWYIPNGLRWSQRWFGSASLRGQSRRTNDGPFYKWNGGDAVAIVHANILQAGSWSVGLNTSIRSVNPTQTGAGSSSQLGEGVSSGFRIATSIGETGGIAFGGEQVIQWDDKTDSGRNLYLMATKGWWLGKQGNDYPLLIANGGFGTGRYANQDILAPWTNPLRFACIENFENRSGTFSVDNDLCWSPIGSISVVFNDYVSTFVEYRSGTAQVAGSVSMSDGIPLRLTWGVDFAQLNQVVEPDRLRWFFRASIGF
ncbi:hypothetical protein [Synechococcus sp. NOUM97013]|uniref:hypothetical protein n=1 Tax=Synechococcus sp. NOUM97013 TaxID=1442555 RepID=UPI0016488E5F|nr:hypothetical protein [Synechococcus sp. NOUM97013]QNI72314.1 hypothetical protein SynNOUM97013_00221 [Synechococcus sp. NOUM97013]